MSVLTPPQDRESRAATPVDADPATLPTPAPRLTGDLAASAAQAHAAVAAAADAATAPTAPPTLDERREALLIRYRWALTPEEALVHRRLLNAGRVAEARALVEQAEALFMTARRALPQMHEDELAAFEEAVDTDDGPRRVRIVASVLRRVGRESVWRDSEAPLLTDEV